MRINHAEQVGSKINGFLILDYKREDKRGFYYVECPFCKSKKWIRDDSISKYMSCGCYNKEHNYKKPKDISGKKQKNGRLTAIEPTNKRDKHNGSVIWKCRCECGNEVLVAEHLFTKEDTKSCGCLMPEVRAKNGKMVGAFIKGKYCINGTNIKNLTSKVRENSTSGIKGVTLDKKRNKWTAQIRLKGKNYYLGRYDTIEEAADARREGEEQIFKPFLENLKKKEEK